MTRKLYCNGFSLLEILIATFILAFGLLGVLGVCIGSLQRMDGSYWQTLSVSQIANMHEQADSLSYTCEDIKSECRWLLPHGECQCDAKQTSVCWSKKNSKQCVKIANI